MGIIACRSTAETQAAASNGDLLKMIQELRDFQQAAAASISASRHVPAQGPRRHACQDGGCVLSSEESMGTTVRLFDIAGQLVCCMTTGVLLVLA